MAKLDWERARSQRLDRQPRSFGARWRKVDGEWCVETQEGRRPGQSVIVRSRKGEAEVRLDVPLNLTENGILWRVKR